MQTKNVNILMATDTHKRLKVFAAAHDTTMGGAIRLLLDTKEGRPDYRCKEYHRWLQNLVAVGRESGDHAAQEYIEANPYMG